MNDLAEKALHGLDVARRQLRDHPLSAAAVAGFGLAGLVVAAGARGGARPSTRALTSWLGLVDTRSGQPANELPAALMFAGLVALVALWVVVVEVVRRTSRRAGHVWWVALAWAVPFAVGPPLMDTGVYRDVAYGLLQRAGHDPYTTTPSRLVHSTITSAIDPSGRVVSSASGPLGSIVSHLAVSIGAGHPLAAVIVLRAVGVLVAVWIGRLAADLAGARAPEALSLTVLNPLLLLYIVSAAHLDGLMIALLLAALVAAVQRRWLIAVALACLAGSVTGQGFVAVPILITAHALGRRTVAVWRIVGRDLAVAVVVTGVLGLVSPGHFGWVTTVDNQFAEHTPFSIAGAVGEILTPIVHGASYDDLAAGARITAIIAATCVIGYLVITDRQRPLDRTTGYALLALGLLAPVLHPWYLLWGLLCLAPLATGPRRAAVLILSGTACLLTPPGFSTPVTDVLSGAVLAAAALVTGALLVLERRRAPDPSTPEPVTVGR